MYRSFRLFTVFALIFLGVFSFSAPTMEWGRMVGQVTANAPAHVKGGNPIDFTVILKVTGDPSSKIDTFSATISILSGFSIPLGEKATKKIKNLLPNQVRYIYWHIRPPAVTGTYNNAIQMNASYNIGFTVHNLTEMQRNIRVVSSQSTPQFQVTNNIVGDFLAGGYIEIIQTVVVEGGNPQNLVWGNFLSRYDILELVDIKSNLPQKQDPQTYYADAISKSEFSITYKFYINPKAPVDTLNLNNYFLGDTGQWRTQDSETLGTGLPDLVIYPRGFQGIISECRTGIGIANIPVSVYRMDDTLYDDRSSSITTGEYFFGVKDVGTYKLYFNDPSRANHNPSYSSLIDDNNGAGHVITDDSILTVNACIYHYIGGAVYFDSDLYRNGDMITVTVEDLDHNTDPAVSDTALVTITSSSGDAETLILNELGTNSGIFQGSIPVIISGFTQQNSMLEGQHLDTLTVHYHDEKSYTGFPADYYDHATLYDTTTSYTYFTDKDSNIVSGYAIGNTVYIMVTDADENKDDMAIDQVLVVVYDDLNNDTETITLNETGVSTGIFIGEIPLTYGPANIGNGILESYPGQKIIARYTDIDDATDISHAYANLVDPSVSGVIFTDGADKAYKYVIDRDTVFITVNDADQNFLADTIEAVTVKVSSSNDTETLTLYETGYNTGIFKNTTGLPLSSSPGLEENGVLNVAGEGTINVIYQDKYDNADTSIDTAQVIFPTISSIDLLNELGQSATFYLVGKNVFAEVMDQDKNLNPNVRETINVNIKSIVNNDSEIVQLLETAPDSGIFRNITGLPIMTGDAVLENNICEVTLPDTISATYTDLLDPTDVSYIEIPVLYDEYSSILNFTDQDKSVRTGYRIGEKAYILLSDKSLNLDPGIIDTATVIVTNQSKTDTETVTLFETSANSGIFFSAGINIFSGAPVPGDNSISSVDKGYIFAFYQDPYDPYDISTDSAYTVMPSIANIEIYNHLMELTDVILAGKQVHLFVDDPDNDLDPNKPEQVILKFYTGNDTEAIILNETGNSTGRFYTSLNTDTGPVLEENGVLSGSNDQIAEIEYIDKYDVNEKVYSNFRFKEPFKSILVFTDQTATVVKDSFYSGEKIYVRLTDKNRDLYSDKIDTITLTLSSQIANDTENITLYETGANSGIFVNSGIITQRQASGPNDGILTVALGDIVIADYIDRYDENDISRAEAYILEPASRIKTLYMRSGGEANTFQGSAETSITASTVSWDQNPPFRKNFLISDIMNATFFISSASDNTGEIIIERVFPNNTVQVIAKSNVFNINTFNEKYEIGVVPFYNDVLEGQKLRMTLKLNSNATVYFNSAARDSKIDIPTTTVINVDWGNSFYHSYNNDDSGLTQSGSFYRGQNFFIRQKVSDPFGSQDVLDSNGGRLIIPTLAVDQNMSMVYDSNYAHKIFESSLSTLQTGIHPVTLYGVESNGVIDSYTFNIEIISTDSEILFTESTYRNKTSSYILGETVYIRLDDADKDLTYNVADTVTVLLTDPVSGDSESIVLTETENGVFTGSIMTSALAATPDNGVLETAVGNTINVDYTDPIDPTDTSSDSAFIILRTPSVLTVENTNFVETTNFKPNQSFYIRVVDPDNNKNSLSRDIIYATLHSNIGNDTEIITLTETDINTGIFLSDKLEFLSTASGMNDGIISVSSPDTVVVTYIDPEDPTDTSDRTVFILPATLGILTLDSTDYSEGDTITITLYDPDLNTDINAAEKAYVHITGKSGDTEIVELIELSVNSDTFIGHIVVIEDEIPHIHSVYDGIFHACGDFIGNTVTVSYTDNSIPAGNWQTVTKTALFHGTPKYEVQKQREFSILAQSETQNYSIYFRNYSTTTAPAFEILDPVPDNTVYVDGSASGGGVLNGNTVAFSIGSLDPSGNESTRTFSVSVSPSALDGTLIDNYAILRENTDIYTNIVTFKVGAFPDLVLSVTDSPDPVNAGETINYTITVENIGNTASVNILIESQIPDLTSYLSGGTLIGETVTLTLSRLERDQKETFSYSVLVDVPIPDQTKIHMGVKCSADDHDTVYSDIIETTVISKPVLGIVKKVNKIYAGHGDHVRYDLILTNTGTDTAVNLVLSDQIPLRTAYVSSTAGGALNGSYVQWNIPTFPIGEELEVSFTIEVLDTANEGDMIGNIARAKRTIDTEYVYSNIVYFEVRRYPYLQIDKDSEYESIFAGDQISYNIVFSNVGSDTALNVTISDTMPVLFSIIDSSHTYALISNRVYWTFPTLGVDVSETITLTLLSDISIPDGTYATNYASIKAGWGNKDHSSHTVLVNNTSELTLALSGPVNVVCDEIFDYVISYQNSSAIPLTDVVIYDTIPYPLIYVSGGVFDGEGVRFDIGNVSAFSSINTASFSVRMPEVFTNGYIIKNKAYATFGTELTYSNEWQTTVVSSPDISISKQVSHNACSSSDTLIYTLIVENTGTDTALNVVISDTVPLYLVYEFGADAYIGGVCYFYEGALLSGQTMVNTFVVSIDPSVPQNYTVTNYATASGDNYTIKFSNFTNTMVGDFADIAVIITGKNGFIFNETATFSIVCSNIGDTPTLSYDIRVDIPEYFVIIDQGTGIVSGNIIEYTKLPLNYGDSDTVNFTVRYGNYSPQREDLELIKAWAETGFIEKSTRNNTFIHPVMFTNDYYYLYVVDSKKTTVKRTLLSGIFRSYHSDDFEISTRVISPNGDGFKDTLIVFYNDIEIIFNGLDDSGDVLADGRYFVRLQIMHADGEIGIHDEEFFVRNDPAELLEQFKLYPNPAKGEKITISYIANYGASVRVDIYDVSGNRVMTIHNNDPYNEEVIWDMKNEKGKKIASGIYFIVLTAEYNGKREIYTPIKSAIVK